MFPFSAAQKLSRPDFFYPVTRNIYFLCFSELNGWNTSFSLFYLLPDILFLRPGAHLFPRKKVIPCLPINKSPLRVKIQRNPHSLLISGLFALARPWLMDGDCIKPAGWLNFLLLVLSKEMSWFFLCWILLPRNMPVYFGSACAVSWFN